MDFVEEVVEGNVDCEGDIIKMRLRLFKLFCFIGIYDEKNWIELLG